MFVTGITGKGAWSYYRSRSKSKDHHADLEFDSKETYYSSLEKRFNKQFDLLYQEVGEVRKENKDLSDKIVKITIKYRDVKKVNAILKHEIKMIKKQNSTKSKKRGKKKDETKKSSTDST